MARSLAANLATALARDEHEPAIDISSQSFADTIPMDGNAFNFSNDYTWRPYVIYHSSGRWCAITREQTAGDLVPDKVYFIYTDVDRTSITRVEIEDLSDGVEDNIDYLAITEKSDGNIAVMMIRYGYNDTTATLYSATITITGAVTDGPNQLLTFARASNGEYGASGLSITRFSNGTYYCVYCYTTATGWAIYKLTSADFSSWTGPTAINPSGLTTGSSEEVQGVYVFEDTVENNDCFLLFAYTDTVESEESKIFNIYSMLSADYGATWGAPAARTTYSSLGSSAKSPVIIQKSSGMMYLAFFEHTNVLRLDENSVGWQDSDFGSCPAGFNVRTFYYNASQDHITCSYGAPSSYPGNKQLCGVLVIDMSTWTIEANYNEYSSPAMNQAFAENSIYEAREEFAQGTKFISVVTDASVGYYNEDPYVYDSIAVMVLDVEDGEFTYYVFAMPDDEPWAAYGLTANIHITHPGWFDGNVSENDMKGFRAACLNETSADKIYFAWSEDFPTDARGYHICYVDLTVSADDDGFYEVSWIGGQHASYWERYEIYGLKYISVIDSVGYIIVGSGDSSYRGGLSILDSTTGVSLYNWRTTDDSDFPYHGCYSKPVYHDRHVYFNIHHYSVVGYINMRGLADINLDTESITTHRPTWSSDDNYLLYGYYAIDTINNVLWMAPYCEISAGEYVTAASYNIASGAWTAYTYLTFNGIPETASPSRGQNIFYDHTTGNIGVGLGRMYGVNTEYGCILFNVSAGFNQIKYLTASYDAGWTWDDHDDIATLVQSTTSSNPAACVDGDDVLWLLWDNYAFTSAEYTLYWDRDMGAYSLHDYLINEVRIRWELKKPNMLDFTLARGQLFDPQNRSSILRDIVAKGRLLIVQMGENYQGSEYLENQGKFVVTSVRLSYGMHEYPKISVHAESLSTIWKEQHIVSTSLYAGAPDAAIESILQNDAQLDAADYDIPLFSDSHIIDHQFVDMSVWNMLEDICDHWNYFLYDDHDGIFTCVELDFDKTLDHTYSATNKLSGFTPDDSESDFTNAVRVIGESLDFTDVTYDEELVGTLVGTVGWWENRTTHTVEYSNEGETSKRKCVNPRLRIVQSIKLQGLLAQVLGVGKGGESITDTGDDTYCVVTLDIPDLTPSVISSIGVSLATGYASIGCDGFVSGYCGSMIAALATSVGITMYLLGTVANYQYEIYAQPKGEVKQTVQYLAEDTIHQQNMAGRVVVKEIEDPLCYTVAECTRVANANLEIVQAQRNRVRFRKVAHMQDEIGDKIRVIHPYSNETMDIMIVSLTRIYKKGANSGAGMWDEIEGWRVD